MLDEVSKAKYTAQKVFIIFETEAAQRAALRDLTRGTIPGDHILHKEGSHHVDNQTIKFKFKFKFNNHIYDRLAKLWG